MYCLSDETTFNFVRRTGSVRPYIIIKVGIVNHTIKFESFGDLANSTAKSLKERLAKLDIDTTGQEFYHDGKLLADNEPVAGRRNLYLLEGPHKYLDILKQLALRGGLKGFLAGVSLAAGYFLWSAQSNTHLGTFFGSRLLETVSPRVGFGIVLISTFLWAGVECVRGEPSV